MSAQAGDAPMAAVASEADVSSRMSRQRRRDTLPEMRIRRELHRLGYRYRVDAALPGMPRRRADLLFTRRRLAVFVDGCFWHGCPTHGTYPRNNGDWWRHKIETNIARDRETDRLLAEEGWQVVRVWEHEPTAAAVYRILGFLVTRTNDSNSRSAR